MTDHRDESAQILNQALVEYGRRIDRGEAVDREEFIQNHPQIAADLRAHFCDLDFAETLLNDPKSLMQVETKDSQALQGTTPPDQQSVGLTPEQRRGLVPFGPFRIDRVLGVGGMGVVYAATELELNREVALKLPALTAGEAEPVLKRFRREAQVAANLRHPNICTIYGFGDVAGVYYLSMPVMTGRSLNDLLSDPGQPSVESILDLIIKVAKAMSVAHQAGIVHRDLKPANIMLEDNHEPMILDFGLAIPTQRLGEEKLTQTGGIPGTPAYMAPEQLFPALGETGPAADIFSLGVILHELLTGQRPFPQGAIDLLADGTSEPADLPSTFHPELGSDIDDLCRKMLTRDPKDRCQSMQEVAATLTEISDRASKEQIKVQPQRKSHFQKTVIGGSIVALSVAVFFALWATGIILKVEVADGTLVIKVPNDEFTANIEGKTVKIVNTTTEETTTITLTAAETKRAGLKPGNYEFLVETDSGFKTRTSAFTITSNTDELVDVWWERNSVSLPPPMANAPLDEDNARRLQEQWAEYLNVPVTRDIDLGNDVRLTMMLIPPGKFQMGSTNDQLTQLEQLAPGSPLDDVSPQTVVVSEPFWLSRFEITHKQFQHFVQQTDFITEAEQDGIGGWGWPGERPNKFDKHPRFNRRDYGFAATDQHPVLNVCRADATAFCKWLSQLGGQYELPTEAQWEYACRAGSTRHWHWGDDVARLREHGWYNSNSAVPDDGVQKPQPVGQLKPNAWGLHDMYGNVSEWCQDDADLAVSDRPEEGNAIRRGGGWSNGWAHVRSANRQESDSNLSDFNLGFRVAAKFNGPHLQELAFIDETVSLRKFTQVKEEGSAYTPQHFELVNRLRTATLDVRADTQNEIANLKWPADQFQRDRIPRNALAAAGWGDASKAPQEIVALLGDARLNCWSDIYDIALSSDGQEIVAAHKDGSVSFHDASTGHTLGINKCHDDIVMSVATSPDDEFFVTGCLDGSVAFWERDGGAEIARIADHTERVSEARFSPDGRMFATASFDNSVRLYSCDSPTKATYILPHGGDVLDLEFATDHLLVTASSDDKLRVWHVGTGKLERELPGHPGTVRAIEMSRETGLLASLDTKGKLLLRDTTEWSIVKSLQTTPNTSPLFAISSNGKSIVVRESKEVLGWWDTESGELTKKWSAPPELLTIYALCVDPTGQFVVSGNRTGKIRIRDFAEDQDRFANENCLGVAKAELSQDGTQLVLKPNGTHLHAWDLNTHTMQRVKATRPDMVCVDVSADGRQLVTAGASWKPALFDIESGKLLSHPRRGHTNIVHAVKFSHDGSMIASGASDRHLWIWDRKTMKGTDIPCGTLQRIRSLTFSPNDELIALGDRRGVVQVRSSKTGELIATFNGEVGESYALIFTPDGKQLIQGTGNGVIKIWDMEGKKLVTELKAHSKTILSLKLSRNGRTLASASYDGSIILWDTQSWKAIRTIELYPFGFGHVYLAGFTPEDRHLIAAGRNGLAYVLRLAVQ